MEDTLKFRSLPVTDVRAYRSEDNSLITEVEGFAAVYGNVDSYGEIIDAGAFNESIAERLPSKQIKLLADHDMWNVDKVIGVPVVIEDRAMPNGMMGLYFKAMISAARSAQDVATKLVEGIVDRLSVGTRTTVWGEDENGIMHNVRMTLYDISIVPYAANDLARVTGVRSVGEILDRLKTLPEAELQQVRNALAEEKPPAELPAIANENEVVKLMDFLKTQEA